MKCIKTKKFLWWSWTVIEHDYKIFSISKFMDCSTSFHVNRVCVECEATELTKFVEKDTLILEGVPVKILENIRQYNGYYPKVAINRDKLFSATKVKTDTHHWPKYFNMKDCEELFGKEIADSISTLEIGEMIQVELRTITRTK